MKTDYITLNNKEFSKKISNQNYRKKYNYGLALLKSFLAFLVVIAHYFNPKSTTNKIILIFTKDRKFHVPCFFIMSFYFMCNNIISLDIKIIFNRLIRLLIPYIGWPFILWKTNNIFNKFFNKNLPDSYKVLLNQLLWGRGFLGQFWFQWNLIAITLFFIIIIYIFKKQSLFLLQMILIFCYTIQYSGYHLNNSLVNYPKFDKITIGFLTESIPYAVAGFNLGFYKIIDILQIYRIKTIILSIFIYKLISDYNIFVIINGLNFQGINLNIKSICIIFFFSSISFNKIQNKYASKFLTIITNYSAGIYYLHASIHHYFCYFLKEIKRGTIFGIFLIYFICYFICFFGMLIFGKTHIKHLFC